MAHFQLQLGAPGKDCNLLEHRYNAAKMLRPDISLFGKRAGMPSAFAGLTSALSEVASDTEWLFAFSITSSR